MNATTTTQPARTSATSTSQQATPSVLEMAYRVQLELEERFAGLMAGGYPPKARLR